MHVNDFKGYEEFRDHAMGIHGTQSFCRSWITGGRAGGSCWGSNADEAVEAEPEPDDIFLDELLMAFCPDLTFLEYRKLMRSEIYRNESFERREYYGNYTSGMKSTLLLDALYKALKGIYQDRS